MSREACADIRYLTSDLLQLCSGSGESGRDGSIGCLTLLFEVFEFVFCLYDLSLPCIILLLCDGSIFQSLIHLVLNRL